MVDKIFIIKDQGKGEITEVPVENLVEFGGGNSIKEQVYKTISSNATLDDSYHNAIVRITANATITIPIGLRDDFNCVFDAIGSVIGTFVAGSGITISAPFGLVLLDNAMCTLYKISTSNFRLNGGLISA